MQADDVSSGQSVTNRANTIKVSRIKGFVVYMAESETEMVEWMSALEGTVSRLLKIIAGCDDEDEAPPPSHSSASHHNSMLAQAEQSFKQRAQQPSWSESQQQRSSFGVQGVLMCLLRIIVCPQLPRSGKASFLLYVYNFALDIVFRGVVQRHGRSFPVG